MISENIINRRRETIKQWIKESELYPFPYEDYEIDRLLLLPIEMLFPILIQLKQLADNHREYIDNMIDKTAKEINKSNE